MRIERGGSGEYLFIDMIDGPPGWQSLILGGQVTAEFALVTPDVTPAAGDWHPTAWQGLTVRFLVTAAQYPVNGDYLAKVRLSAGSEQVVKTSGRVTLG